MSVEHTGWVWRYSRAEGGALLVALALADHINYSDGGDECWPSRERLAQRARLSERQVSRCLAELEELGEIERVRTQNGNRYRLVMPMGQDVTRHPRQESGDAGVTTDGTPASLPSEEPEREQEGKQQALLPDPVREVWDHYMQAFPRSRRALDSARRTCIKRALKVRTVDECKRAIDYIAHSPYHNGQNENQTKYDDIKYALGLPSESPDARIDKWLAQPAPTKHGATTVEAIAATVPSDARDYVREKMRHVELMYQRPDDPQIAAQGQGALSRLASMRRPITPILDANGRVEGWRRAEA